MRLSQSPEGELKIEGIVDAAKLVSVNGPKAQELADLALHKMDLMRSDSYLNGINLLPVEAAELREGLYMAALIRCMKCFGFSESRPHRLDGTAVLGTDAAGLACFKRFKKLRDKHFAHDENSFAQCSVGAVLNDGAKPYKVEKVVAIPRMAVAFTEDDWRNLKLVIQRTLEFVSREIDRVCTEISEELERLDYSDLTARPQVWVQPAMEADVGRKRDRSHLR